jgi:hypothetical protein
MSSKMSYSAFGRLDFVRALAMTEAWAKRASIFILGVLALGLAVNTVGIAHNATLRTEDIGVEREPYVYMVENTPRRLRIVPSLLNVSTDPSLADTWRSSVQIFENDLPLPDPAASFQDMMDIGAGRYTYRPERLSFTTSDNSDPRTNGRTYVIAYRLGLRWNVLGWLTVALVAVRALLVLRYPPKSAQSPLQAT